MNLTVVIPCKNEASYIVECIDAIYACDLPADMQMKVFVVDGMSDDGTRDLVQELTSKYPSLGLVDNEKELTPFAFNLGIYAGGKTEYVQIVGARHILSKNYLMECLTILQSKADVWCVGGRIINEYINTTGETISKAMGTAFGMGIGNFRTLSKSGYTDTVTSPMYPYWVFEKIGFFDEALIRNQDDDFNFRVSKAGGKIYYEHNISLKYYVRGNFRQLRRQFFQYGYWKIYVNKKHKAVTTLRQTVPMLFVLYTISFVIAALTPFGKLWSTPMLLYLILNAYFSLKNAKNISEFPKLLMTYFFLHLSYGFGYLTGIWHFLVLNRQPSDNQKRLSR